jgi:hypothetical protein
MVRAGALYFAIVIAFIIAIVTASLIMLAAHYRNSYLKTKRFDRLLNNLNSGITYMMANKEVIIEERKIDLFGNQADSLIMSTKPWGIYEVVILKSFIAKDTLQKAFLMGKKTDSVVLYLCDEDRPLSMSGTTKLTGNAFLPKAGLKKAYADGKPYVNEKLIYQGSTKFSGRSLKKPDSIIINQLTESLNFRTSQFLALDQNEESASFLELEKQVKLPNKATLKNIKLEGNIILFADSMVHITSTAKLSGIQIYAPVIKVDEGFKGDCQLFATDSIIIGQNVVLNYPSVLGIISSKKKGLVPTITIGDGAKVAGVIFTYEEKRTPLQTMVSLGKKTIVNGEIYSTGMIKVEKGVIVNGKLSCNKFIMQTPTTLYENFLIDVTFNRLARSKYYLSSKLFGEKTENQILKWLN